MQDEVKVSQADREAYLSMNTLLQKYRDDVMAGEWDSANGMQALARHRHQAERAFEERERELREALKPFSRGHLADVTLKDYQRARQALKETPDAG